MNAPQLDDHFIFIYGLEPSELCSNFRFASVNFQTFEPTERVASFVLWKNMLGLLYSTRVGAYEFDVLRANADHFAKTIVSWHGWLTRTSLELIHRNWVEIEGPLLSQMRKKVVGTFEHVTEPPIDHQDNEPFKKMVPLIILSLKNVSLASALDDYHTCLSQVSPDFYFHAYRAVEDIRSHFGTAENEDGKKKAWNAMNKALGREEGDYEELRELAGESRHANILGAVIDHATAQRQLDFVGSLIRDFTQYLSQPKSADASKVDKASNPHELDRTANSNA